MNRALIRLAVLAILLSQVASGQDKKLDAVLSSLLPMRGKPIDFGGPRGATLQLIVVKHALRDWAEGRIERLDVQGDVEGLEKSLNSELRRARAICGYAAGDQACPEWTHLGYLGALRVRRVGAFTLLQTGVGIECGEDESAYLYAWSDEGWRRVWQNEQNAYTETEYRPQTIHSVLVSPWNKENDYLVLTLGTESWCQSALHNVYYRVFRLGPDPMALPLVSGEEWARVDDDPPIHGSVSSNDVLVQFTPANPDAEVAVRHYRIDSRGARRTDPLALSPRGFVSEWLTHAWRETSQWSEGENRGAMRDLHERLFRKVEPDYPDKPTMHCKGQDVWQVTMDFGEYPAQSLYYFLVRWRPPYRFTMVEASQSPSPSCNEKDPVADEFRTLFP